MIRLRSAYAREPLRSKEQVLGTAVSLFNYFLGHLKSETSLSQSCTVPF